MHVKGLGKHIVMKGYPLPLSSAVGSLWLVLWRKAFTAPNAVHLSMHRADHSVVTMSALGVGHIDMYLAGTVVHFRLALGSAVLDQIQGASERGADSWFEDFCPSTSCWPAIRLWATPPPPLAKQLPLISPWAGGPGGQRGWWREPSPRCFHCEQEGWAFRLSCIPSSGDT